MSDPSVLTTDVRRVFDAPAERVLAFLGGALAIVFGALVFVLQLFSGFRGATFGLTGLTGAIVTLAVVAIFGALVILMGERISSRPRDASMIIGAFSIVLLALGGLGGAIGGILGLVSTAIVLTREFSSTP